MYNCAYENRGERGAYRMGALIAIGALIGKNAFEVGRLQGAKSNLYGTHYSKSILCHKINFKMESKAYVYLGKVCLRASLVAHQAGAYPGVSSHEATSYRNISTPPGWDANKSQVYHQQ